VYGSSGLQLLGTTGGDNIVGTMGASEPLVFRTASSERARITSGGEFLVGATSASNGSIAYFKQAGTGNVIGTRVESAGAYSALEVAATAAAFATNVLFLESTRAASNAFDFIQCDANAVAQFRVSGDGVIYAQNTTVQSISDARLKENVRNATEGLNVINALRPVRYDWKEGFGNDRKDQLGFIAQEVEAVFPDAVGEWKLGEESEEVYKTVGPGALIPVLVKAIQELKAELDATKAEVAALKGA